MLVHPFRSSHLIGTLADVLEFVPTKQYVFLSFFAHLVLSVLANQHIDGIGNSRPVMLIVLRVKMKRMKSGTLGFIALAIGFAIFIAALRLSHHFFVDTIPEHDACAQFVQTHAAVTNLFGSPLAVSDSAPTRVSRSSGSIPESGRYSFEVEGPKGKGKITVVWRRSGNRDEPVFEQLLRQRPMEQAESIWEKEESQNNH